jgi:hypothetical protein
VNSLKAKKLDIDFDSLNFDEISPEKEEDEKVIEPSIITKIVPTAEPLSKDANKKLNELHNSKAISSSDFDIQENANTKEKLAKFSNANGISSADLYGEQGKKSKEGTSLEDKIGIVKDAISEASSKVKDFAKKMINYAKK